MWYRPLLSDSTMTVIFVFAFRACTKAARNGAPSGPVTVPEIVAAYANEAEITIALTKPRMFLSLNGCIRPPLSHYLRCLHAGTRTKIRLGPVDIPHGGRDGSCARVFRRGDFPREWQVEPRL